MINKPHSKNKNCPGTTLAGLPLLLLAFALALVLTACQDQGPTATPSANTGTSILPGVSQAAVTPSSAGPTTLSVAPEGTTVAAVSATATPALPTTAAATPTVVADSQANAALTKIEQAARKMSTDAKTFRYQLTQTGQLDSGGSVSAFEAAGSGEYQRPAFHQLLTLKVSGQEQAIELYGTTGQLFQRVTGLVTWRKVQPTVTGPFPGLAQAQGFASAGTENLDSLKTSKYTFSFPATLLLPTSGQPEGLGTLSITNLYQSFTGDTASQVQATVWVDDVTGYIARYSVTTSLTAGSAKLTYTATYDYSEFDSVDVKVETPGDLPK